MSKSVWRLLSLPLVQGRFHAHLSLLEHPLLSVVSQTCVLCSITRSAVHLAMSHRPRCAAAIVQSDEVTRTHHQLTTRIIESFLISIFSSGLGHPQFRVPYHRRRPAEHCLVANHCVIARSSLALSANPSTAQDTIAFGTCNRHRE